MITKIRVKIEFEQINEDGKIETVNITEEKKFSSELIETIDGCERSVLDVGNKAFRKAVAEKMSNTSKKKQKP